MGRGLRLLMALSKLRRDFASDHGLGGRHQHSLEEIGEKFDLTRERVRQIEERVKKKLKNYLSKELREIPGVID